MWRVDLVLLASWAVCEAKSDAWRKPALLQNLHKAIHMEDMPAREQHRGRLPQPTCPADSAKLVTMLSIQQLLLLLLPFVVFRDTVGLKTGQTLGFSAPSLASMSAHVHFFAAAFNFRDTVRLAATVLERLLGMVVGFLDFFLTKTALSSLGIVLSFFTSHTHVVGLHFTFCAKVSGALGTSAPVSG